MLQNIESSINKIFSCAVNLSGHDNLLRKICNNYNIDFPRWMRTGSVPKLVDFGPAFQNGWYETADSYSLFIARDQAIQKFSFALPCHEAITYLKRLSPLIEVGARTGAWAHILSRNGSDIVATDKNYFTGYAFRSGRYYPVARISADTAVRRYPDRNVLMVWPCYDDEWATNAVRMIRPGRTLALISEGEGGCVGADSLFQFLYRHFQHIDTVAIPCWYGMHDRMDIYRR